MLNDSETSALEIVCLHQKNILAAKIFLDCGAIANLVTVIDLILEKSLTWRQKHIIRLLKLLVSDPSIPVHAPECSKLFQRGCKSNQATPWIKFLLDRGCCLHLKDAHGMTGLHYACWDNSDVPTNSKAISNTFNLLLSTNLFDVNEPTDDGRTPLYLVCENSQFFLANILLKHSDCNPFQIDQSNNTCLAFCNAGSYSYKHPLIINFVVQKYFESSFAQEFNQIMKEPHLVYHLLCHFLNRDIASIIMKYVANLEEPVWTKIFESPVLHTISSNIFDLDFQQNALIKKYPQINFY